MSNSKRRSKGLPTESFYEDMVIDTPEAAANLTALFESGVK